MRVCSSFVSGSWSGVNGDDGETAEVTTLFLHLHFVTGVVLSQLDGFRTITERMSQGRWSHNIEGASYISSPW